MNVVADISAVQARIAQITAAPAPESAPPVLDASAAGGSSRFANVLSAALQSGAPARVNAPVPPERIDALVRRNAAVWQVDAALIKAVIVNESGFDANATSKAGAQGLMQLMPGTAASLGVRDAYDPAQNVAGGARYLRGLLDRFGGDTRLAIAAYNAGPGAVEKYGDVPPYAQTRNYVHDVLASYDAYNGVSP